MLIDEDFCYKPKKICSCSCYFHALGKTKHAGITCHDEMMLIVEHWENKVFFFSVRHKDVCMIACNTQVATQLVNLGSFDCTRKEVHFHVAIEDDLEKTVFQNCFKKHIKKQFRFLPFVLF